MAETKQEAKVEGKDEMAVAESQEEKTEPLKAEDEAKKGVPIENEGNQTKPQSSSTTQEQGLEGKPAKEEPQGESKEAPADKSHLAEVKPVDESTQKITAKEESNVATTETGATTTEVKVSEGDDKEMPALAVAKAVSVPIIQPKVEDTEQPRAATLKRKGEVLKRPQDVTTVVTRNGRTWNEMFDALVDYKAEYGDCRVPDRFKNKEGVCLGLWVRNQRRRKESLTADQQQRLTELGLDWQTQNERFDSVWHER